MNTHYPEITEHTDGSATYKYIQPYKQFNNIDSMRITLDLLLELEKYGYRGNETYQQVVDWFREKHQISIIIIPWGMATKEHYFNIRTVTEEAGSGMFSSYYDAYHNAIISAIEFLKDKNDAV